MTKVALSGANGQLGRVLRPALLARGYDLRSAAGSKPLDPISPGAIDAPKTGFQIVWGVSGNTRSYWDNSSADQGGNPLGYRPKHNAEDYAAEIVGKPNPLDPVAQRHQGGSFASFDFTPVEKGVVKP